MSVSKTASGVVPSSSTTQNRHLEQFLNVPSFISPSSLLETKTGGLTMNGLLLLTGMSNYCVTPVSLKERGCAPVMLSAQQCPSVFVCGGVCVFFFADPCTPFLFVGAWLRVEATGFLLFHSSRQLVSLCYSHLSSSSKNNFLSLRFTLTPPPPPPLSSPPMRTSIVLQQQRETLCTCKYFAVIQ